MSGAYDAYLEALGRGYDESVHFTCGDHLLDDYVRTLVETSAVEDEFCTYCRAKPAAPVSLVQEALMGAVNGAFVDANGEPVWDSEDKQYFIETFTHAEAVEEFIGALTDFDPLADEIYKCLRDDVDLVRADWNFTSYEDALSTAWREFGEMVKHRQRYAFWLPELDDGSTYGVGAADYIQPSKILHEVAQMIRDNRSRLLQEIGTDTKVWRCRTYPSELPSGWDSATELGTVPTAYATRPNRMSAPGIPMFYGSMDAETAVAEVARRHDPRHDVVAKGAFLPSRTLIMVDLTNLDPLPSLFDSGAELESARTPAFLHRFVADLSAPVASDAELVDYVPTQVVTEFMIHALERMLPDISCIDGIIYPSAVRPGGRSIVLDVRNAACVAAPTPQGAWAWSKPGLELILDAASPSKQPLHP